MKCCYQIFQEDAFRKRLDIHDRRKPISKSVFDSLSVNIAWLTDDERNELVKSASQVKAEFIKLCHEDKYGAPIALSLLLGLRISECIGLSLDCLI